MAVRRIHLLGDPALYTVCEPIGQARGPELTALCVDLKDTLTSFRRKNGFGRGIAAPQIGVLKRVVVVDASDCGFSGAMVDPHIVWESEERVPVWDDCFSLPDLVVQVSRAAEVQVRYRGLDGSEKTLDAEGELSELLQHEVDHLGGILMLDRAITPHSVWHRQEWLRHRRDG